MLACGHSSLQTQAVGSTASELEYLNAIQIIGCQDNRGSSADKVSMGTIMDSKVKVGIRIIRLTETQLIIVPRREIDGQTTKLSGRVLSQVIRNLT